ncbi:hypothetical protein FSY75_16080 [Streptomyces sp. TR1341]|uniref:hypothetical protein n=1 Tax=Streptomyces TaxID=1883 RepID=UPI000FFE366A|nr:MULTISPECIES: hypothetical protein [Streptomyces]NDK25953.1 hypothetical protein [Streptomyces sp. TR1341]UWW90951.1 hypothetical protein GO605_08850 [Streptomyces murinus]WSI88187.1 hypothetical protein OG516_28410 [Streptomyces murinus]WUD09816.1 hypothetical protein OG586_28080 [Streptomyces murinus]
MPLIPEEPQIHESAQGPRVTPASGRTAPTPRPVPGPRPAAPSRPGRPGPQRPVPPVQRTPRDVAPAKPGPSGPAVPAAVAGPQIQLIPASAEGAIDAAEEAVDLLLDSGRAPGDVLVITTGAQHPWAEHELSFGETAYWAQHDAGDDVFYTDAAIASRAGSRPVVVVAVNGGAASADVLSLAHTRAGALLIVCGDPQQINAVLGTGA